MDGVALVMLRVLMVVLGLGLLFGGWHIFGAGHGQVEIQVTVYTQTVPAQP